MHLTRLADIEKIKPDMKGAKDIYKQIPISGKDGSPNFSFRVFTVEPGGHTPLHNHPFEHLNYVIEGSGTVVNGKEERDLKKGDFVLIMPGEMHQYKNVSGSQSLLLLCAVPKEYE